MKVNKIKTVVFGLVVVLSSCNRDDTNEKDTEKPTIDISIENGFPTSCATVQKGGKIAFRALFKDNQELGAYSLILHHNFDHHNHDTEVDACIFEPPKTPVNPWAKTATYDIPKNKKEFTAVQDIDIPTDIDAGDYHFMIQLTDVQGWAAMKGISIKITD